MNRPQAVTILTDDTQWISTVATDVLGVPFVNVRGSESVYLSPLEARTLATILNAAADAAENNLKNF